ncbi:MAG: carboxy terminal-processing peptidase [Saprospiraceae bacterium]|nr:carboxy terminal-processing peptidase [Saprospiraceae bacterium]
MTLASVVFNTFNPGEPDLDKKEFFTLQAVVKFMDKVHYAPRSLDDEVSAYVFESFLEAIDPSKRFLTQEDIDQLDDFEFDIDDQIATGSFEFLDLSVALISQAIDRTANHFDELIAIDIDLHSEDSITIDPDTRGFAKDDERLKEYWRKLIQYETMVKVGSLKKSALKDEEPKDEATLIVEAKEDIKKNFTGWFARLKKLRRSDRFEDYLNVITSAYDPHSSYFSPREKESFDQEMYGTYEGIGARLMPEGELTKVTQIIPGGPAWKQQDLEVNDYIVMVAQDGAEAQDVRGWRQDDVIDLIRGKKGTKVVLTVKKKDGSLNEVTIVRDKVVLEEGNAKSLMLNLGEDYPEIGYILLPKFYFESGDKSGCAEDVGKEIKRLKDEGAQGLILDLRNNGGGSLSEVVDMSGLFFEKGPVVQVKSRDRKPYILRDQDASVQYNGPLIIMVNHMSASASEIIAAALQDYNRAVIVGSSSTFGKGTVQRFEELDRFVVGNNNLKPLGEVKITTQKFYRVNGGSTQLRGVTPDIILPMPYNHITIGEKEFETPLAWSEIEPVSYHRYTDDIDRENLKGKSSKRVAESDIFQLVRQRGESLKLEEEREGTHRLDIDTYQQMRAEREAKNKKYRDLFTPIDYLQVRNPASVLDYIALDNTRQANNEDFIKGVKKDIYIEETLRIMQDMISHP